MTALESEGLTKIIELEHPNDGAIHLQIKKGWETLIIQKLLEKRQRVLS